VLAGRWKRKRKKVDMNLKPSKLRVIVSGGGTGGHIFPAIAIANALMKMNAANEILFVGALGRMEMEKVPAAGYKIEGLNISGIQRKLTYKNLILPFRVWQSVMKSKRIIKNFSPDVVIGVGGYASGPLLYAATSMKIPSLIQEQNSYAGVTNKILAKRVQRIFVAYEGMDRFFPKEKIMITGNPVREDMTKIDGKREEALKFFGLEANKKTILVIGGSLGARTINESIEAALNDFKVKDIQLIWQTGVSFHPKAKKAIESLNTNGITTFEFIQRMDYAYAAADVIISRAGASSVSELALVAKPVILVPSPNVAEDHQTKNAMALTDKNAAILVRDADAKTDLLKIAFEILDDNQLKQTLSQNIKNFAQTDSAIKIAEEVYKLVAENNNQE
jgi:UDP-N-acetylglucosamine--N-acetylmuramyl-(pentapeptide) pyrophosphoryl-undecaprenol N-acetylglucosamine transferase